MDKKRIIDQTVDFVKSHMSGETSGHDWFHIERVWKMTCHIAEKEKADMFVVELAALLHDIADWKFAAGDETAGPRKAKEWLGKLGADRKTIEHVCDIIANVSFKGAGVKTKMKTIEGMCVQDADRLDALGAIGIARVFATGSHMGLPIYDPSIKPTMHKTFEDYKKVVLNIDKGRGTSVNHFYEKLLLLKDRMNTKTAKQIAEKRHKFMEYYLKRFFEEWEI